MPVLQVLVVRLEMLEITETLERRQVVQALTTIFLEVPLVQVAIVATAELAAAEVEMVALEMF